MVGSGVFCGGLPEDRRQLRDRIEGVSLGGSRRWWRTEDIVWFVKCRSKLYKCAINPVIIQNPSISPTTLPRAPVYKVSMNPIIQSIPRLIVIPPNTWHYWKRLTYSYVCRIWVNRRFEGKYHHHLQGRISWARKQRENLLAACFHAGILPGLFDPENWGDMFLRNVGYLSTDYTALCPRR
jgi:hypothetical protein